MHTFDGASGADVACLIRRLKHVAYGDVMKAESQLICIGTSATLSSDPNAKNELIKFAGDLFGSKFDDSSIIEETRHSIETYLGPANKSLNDLPSVFKKGNHDFSKLNYIYGENIDIYISKLLEVFSLSDYLNKKSKLSSVLKTNEILQFIVRKCSESTINFRDLVDLVEREFPNYLKTMERQRS